MFQWQPQNVSMYVCPCDVRMHMWRTCVHVTYVCTCDVRVYMWRTYAHVTYVCTCDVRVHMWRTCVHVTYVCTCNVRVHMWRTYAHVTYVCTSGNFSPCGRRTYKSNFGLARRARPKFKKLTPGVPEKSQWPEATGRGLPAYIKIQCLGCPENM